MKLVITLFSFILFFDFLGAGTFEDHKRKHMIQDLRVIKHHFEAGYAPNQWKSENSDFDLSLAFEIAKNQILQTPDITTKQFQQIVRKFITSTKDYHVDVTFFSTEAASLPFTVKSAQGRYFISWIDPIRLPPSYYSMRVGDELIMFDERPIAEVMSEILEEIRKSNDLTDRSIADIKLTSRKGMLGDVVPKGSILVTTKSAKTSKLETCQLHWSYTPENITSSFDFLESIDFIVDYLAPCNNPKFSIPKIEMVNPVHQTFAHQSWDRSGGMGAKKSFIPKLGEVIWGIDDELKEGDENGIKPIENTFGWDAYIYRHPNGQSIGYVRIPHYTFSPDLTKEFGEIIKIMEEKTDALVIDQLHNFGGYVETTYKIASYLADGPLKTPHHRIKITQKEAANAYGSLEMIKIMDLLNPEISILSFSEEEIPPSNEDKKETDNNSVANTEEEDPGYNFQEVLFFKSYCELILEEWNQGKFLTRPTPIIGIDRINPNPKITYSKPIMMLIDEMDFSGGDFMPAILQDNKRALLFGCKTAGAGGFVSSFSFPNSHGIASCSYTGSIAERPNLQKIEETGVTPDIEYSLTPDDLQGDYKGYIEAVNNAVQGLLFKK